MKNKLIKIIILLSVTMISCDRYYHHQLYIINNCNQDIYISITNSNNNVLTFSVNSDTTIMFVEGGTIVSSKGIVEDHFLKFEVTKNGVKSKINYRDLNRWIQVAGIKKYHDKLYLPINPEDFE